jgi:lipopolysaccharide export LptBFGC system permease protein LptF
VGFFYFWMIQVGQDMGRGGVVPPLLAAWLPNLLFGAGAVWWFNRELR